MDDTQSRAGTRFGPYELRALLGRGGMGEVYEAYDTVKDRVVAVKLLPVGLADDPRFQRRFRQESRVAARLAEPHVIPIHDWGEIEGVLYIDMRLVRGSDLRSVLREKGPLSPARAVGIIEQVAAALDAAHAEGLVHRDVKPANILVTPSDFAYLADFGIARSESDPSVTATGQAIGSYSYIAPERFDITPIGGTADVYSLACVLFECLTGAQPFPSDGMSSLIRAHLSTPPPRPTTMRAGLPAALDEVISRGMAKEPADRYPTAGALAAAARAAVSGTPSVPNSQLPTAQLSQRPSRAAATVVFPAFGPESAVGRQSASGPQSVPGPPSTSGPRPIAGPQPARGQQSTSGPQPTFGLPPTSGPQSSSAPPPTQGPQAAGRPHPTGGPHSISGPQPITGLEPTIVPGQPSDPMRRPLDATTEAIAKTSAMPMPQSDAPYPPDRSPTSARRSSRVGWIAAALLVLVIVGVVGWYARNGFGDQSAQPTTPARLPAGAKPCAQLYPALGRFTSSAIGTTVTSCAFAEEVRKAYASSGDTTITDRSIVAHSPISNRDYTMNCTAGDQFATCSGGENAIVYVY
ncbi:protein kinase domain-containing protein [Nocardia sp. CA-129566]|uniref:serine/threonine-protein kinase n=1 Tax=Nocardia sp. CA-129566 TaxID=3239976 RepID=UPI003D997B1F